VAAVASAKQNQKALSPPNWPRYFNDSGTQVPFAISVYLRPAL
jgi:hypothetical protein